MKAQHSRAFSILLSLCLAAVLCPAAAMAENEGLDDLDKATEAKLTAETVQDLSKVIELLESAMDKGLDKENREFAEQLLAASLIGRAEVVAKAIFQNPKQAGARLPQFLALAVKDLERSLALNENQPEAQFLLGRLYAAAGRREQALKALDKVVDAEKVPLEKRVKALLLRGTMHQDEEKRVADYNRAIELAPDNAEAVSGRAVFLLSQGKLDQAVADFTKAIELEPEKAGLYIYRGQALMADDKLDEALRDFDKAVELAPKSPTGYMHRAQVYAIQNNLEKSLDNLNEALRLNPTSPALLLFRARIRAQAGDMEKAMADVDAAANFPQAHMQAQRVKADLLAGSDRIGEGIEVLERLLERFPTSRDVTLQLARFYLIDDQPRKAIQRFTSVIEADPDNAQALRGRGDAYLSIGKQAAAIEDYKAALKHAPENDGLLNNLAWVLATSPDDKLRDGKRALELAEKACEVTDYKEGHILSTLAAAYAETGDFENARKWSRKAVEVGRESQKEQLREELESYKANKPWRELQQVEEKEGEKEKKVGAPARTLEF